VRIRVRRLRHDEVDDRPGVLPIDPDIDDGTALTRARGAGRPAARPRTPPLGLAAIALGGALGASARSGIARAWPTHGGGFPWATLATNVSGSAVLGLLLVIVLERLGPNPYLRPFFATGFLGAYTTFSTFAVETDLLLRDGHVATAAGYVAASLALGLGGVWLGIGAGRALPGRRAAVAARTSTERR
jgi:CrcB protein